MFRILFYLLFFSVFLCLHGSGKTKILLIADSNRHATGAHEHRAGCLLLAKWLNESPLGIHAVVTAKGWPEDKSLFKDAKAVIIYSDGEKRHLLKGHFKELDALYEKGVGIGMIHFALQVKEESQKAFMLKWLGGYYESKYSTNPHWTCVGKVNSQHSAAKGINGIDVFDEWFFNFRFGDKKVIPIITAIPDEQARSGITAHPRGQMDHIVNAKGREEIISWVKDEEGKRSFAFGGGHFHETWYNSNFRKAVLNSIVWTAGLKVPESGVKSKRPTQDELAENQDHSIERSIWSAEKKTLAQSKLLYKTPVIRGSDKKVSVRKEIDLGNAKELILLVLEGGDGIVKDHCAWAEPKLSGSKGTLSLVEQKWESALTGWREIATNHGLEGDKLLIEGKEYKGIATHALSIIRYKIPEGYNKFSVLMGLLDSNLKRGSVQFQIYAR